jgi:hypothetical protein
VVIEADGGGHGARRAVALVFRLGRGEWCGGRGEVGTPRQVLTKGVEDQAGHGGLGGGQAMERSDCLATEGADSASQGFRDAIVKACGKKYA